MMVDVSSLVEFAQQQEDRRVAAANRQRIRAQGPDYRRITESDIAWTNAQHAKRAQDEAARKAAHERYLARRRAERAADIAADRQRAPLRGQPR